jgi:probable HAF family extracellular repeat protein
VESLTLHRTRRTAAIFLTGAFLFFCDRGNAQNYLIDLGAVAPGLGINNAGEVVLQNYTYSSGSLMPLPAGMTGVAISASGQVTGSIVAGGLTYAAVDTGGVVTELPQVGSSPGDPALQNWATGINAGGTVIGWWEYGAIAVSGGAFVINNGTVTNLVFPNISVTGCEGANPPIYAVASGINDNGQITGAAPNPVNFSCASRAFIYDNGVWTDLGPGQGLAINASGQVTGAMFEGVVPNFYTVAFIYSNGASTTIAPLPGNDAGISTGFAINATGQVVGGSFAYDPNTGTEGAERAFYFNGVTNDLNAFISATDPLHAYVSLREARGINDSGLIVVNGVDARTQAQHAYLLQVPLVTVAPGPLLFASQTVGTVSPAQSVTFTNVGGSTVPLGAVTISSDYIETNDCGASLSANGICTVMVSFAPKSGGNPSGSLSVIAGGVPILVPVSGVTPFSASINASAAATTTGTPITLTWTATAGAACTATGGSAADGWIGNLATSGEKSVTESTAGTYTYGLKCTAGGQSAQATIATPVVVSLQSSSASGSHGGGAIDWLSEIFLLGVLGLHHIVCRTKRDREAQT